MPQVRRTSQRGGHILNMFYDNQKKMATFDSEANEIHFKNVNGENKYLTKAIVKIPFKIDGDKIIVNKDYKTAEIIYFSEHETIQAIFKGSVIVIQNKPPDENVPIINPLKGVMERYASSDQFAITFDGNFGGSTRLMSGTISLMNDDIRFVSDEFIYISHQGSLRDIYMYKPEIIPIKSYDPDRYNYAYKYASHQHNNKTYISLKDTIKLREKGTYEQLINKYSQLLSDCKNYGRKKLNIQDKIINQTTAEGLCNIIYLESIGNDNINVEQYFDKLVNDHIMDSIAKAELLKIPDQAHPYNRPDSNIIKRTAMNESYYKNIMYPMDIRLHPNELEILVPIDRDDHDHIYYQWVELGSRYDLFVDTGNHAISGMSLKYLKSRYLQHCPVTQRDIILEKILDTHTPAQPACGIGGVSKCRHIGYIELTFRFKEAPHKGVFTIDCEVNDIDMYDLLIGDQNKPDSKLRSSNMKYLLTDSKIFLKYDPNKLSLTSATLRVASVKKV